jgi:hypothetical protein
MTKTMVILSFGSAMPSGCARAQQQGRLGRPVVARGRDEHDQHGERDERQRDAAVEAAGLGVRPRVQRTHDLAAAVGVRAVGLARAAVADVRLRAVADEAALLVELVRPQVLAFRAAPVVVRSIVGEASGAVAQRAPVGVRRQPLQAERTEHERAGVGGGEYGLGVHVTFAALASSPAPAPSGTAISVNKMPSGSSSVTRLTV